MGTIVPNMSTHNSLSDALFSRTKQGLLGLLFGQPQRSFYLKELITALGMGRGTVQREVSRLSMSDRNCVQIGGQVEISRSALQSLVQHFHIRRIYLFGSAARGELKPDSDIDLLIEFEDKRTPSMGGMVELQDAFIKLFHGRKVDIATTSILNNPYRKRSIEKDMEELYAA